VHRVAADFTGFPGVVALHCLVAQATMGIAQHGDHGIMKFNVTIDRDEDGAWIVECPSIPGCVSQGSTREEALERIQEAIKLCLEVRAERGMPLTVETRQGRGYDLMPPLPVLRSWEVVAAFEKLGWHVARQRGSHIITVKEGHWLH